MGAGASDASNILPSTHTLSLLVKEVTGEVHGALLPAMFLPMILASDLVMSVAYKAQSLWFGMDPR